MGSPEANRNTETLSAAYGNVSPQLARRGKEKQSQGIGNQDGEGTGIFKFLDERSWVLQPAIAFRVGKDSGEEMVGLCFGEGGRGDNFPP